MVFEQAWEIMKAPFIPVEEDGFLDEPFEGTLYSGGDIEDSPEYWTTNLKLALAYALFGSAVPRYEYGRLFRGHGGQYDIGHSPPLRQTVPTMRVSQSDPDWDEFVDIDPHSGEAFRSDTDLTTSTMPQQEVLDLIDRAMNEKFFWHDAKEALHGTTARHHTEDERRQHMMGAKERLATGESGLLDIPDDARYKSLMSFGANDNIKDWIEEDPSDLEMWQLDRLIQDTMFEGLPHANQEHMDEWNRRVGTND